MGLYQRQRSRSTVGIEPHNRQLKTYKKERQENVLSKRERERWEKRYLWTKDQNIRMVLF